MTYVILSPPAGRLETLAVPMPDIGVAGYSINNSISYHQPSILIIVVTRGYKVVIFGK